MLWILSGAPNSGKKTFRDMLIQEYGFNPISKYTGSENMEKGAFKVKEKNSAGEEITIEIAHRDLYLRIPENREINQLLNEIIKGNNADQHIKTLKDRFGTEKIIYPKLDKENGERFYYIWEQDVIEAAFSNDEHYILVCTDFGAIQRINNVCESCKQGSNEKYRQYRDKRYVIKTMYLFGYADGDKTKVEVINQYINKLIEKVGEGKGITGFNYVFTNIASVKYITENFKNQWESLVIRQWDVKDDNMPIKLEDESNDSKRIKSGIFFAKPFNKNGDNGRGKVVYDAINHIGKLIAENYKVKKFFSDRDENTYTLGDSDDLSECNPIRIVQYESESTDNHVVPSIKEDIEKSNLIIVDLSDIKDESFFYNPNCCWELGYARALHKRIIVLVDGNSGLKKLSDEGDNLEFRYELTNDKKLIIETSHDIHISDNNISPVRFGLKRTENNEWEYETTGGVNRTGAYIDSILMGYFRRIQKAINNRLRHNFYKSQEEKNARKG